MVAGWLLEGIGQITSAVSGRQKFSSEFLILFQQDNGRMVPCGKDSGYQSGSASANDTDSFFCSWIYASCFGNTAIFLSISFCKDMSIPSFA